MVTNKIEQQVIDLVTKYSEFYILGVKRYDTYTPQSNIHFDVKLDQDDAEGLMVEYFSCFRVEKGNFSLEVYYPPLKFSWNPFKKQVVDIPEFTVEMLIESAKAGYWLYD